MGLLRKLLKFPAEIAKADDTPDNGPVVLIRDDYGLTPCRIPELNLFRFTRGGQMHEHVDTAADGTWIYAARPY